MIFYDHIPVIYIFLRIISYESYVYDIHSLELTVHPFQSSFCEECQKQPLPLSGGTLSFRESLMYIDAYIPGASWNIHLHFCLTLWYIYKAHIPVPWSLNGTLSLPFTTLHDPQGLGMTVRRWQQAFCKSWRTRISWAMPSYKVLKEFQVRQLLGSFRLGVGA